MGNSDEKISTKLFPSSWGDYIYIKNIRNYFGNIEVVKNKKNNIEYDRIKFADLSDEQMKNIIYFFELMSQFKNINYMQVTAIEQRFANTCCSTPYLGITFDYFEKTLDYNIKNNNISNLKKENEYWGFIFDIMKVIKFEKDNGLPNNFINPKAIFYFEENKTWKLIFSQFYKENNSDNAFLGEEHFCSPELYAQIHNREKKIILTKQSKSNIFSLALIVLKSIYLKNLDIKDFYIKQNLEFDFIFLKNRINNLREKGFSDLFIYLLHDMTEQSVKKRISIQKFFFRIGPHKSDLIDFKKQKHKNILEGLKIIVEKTSVYMSVSDEEESHIVIGDIYDPNPRKYSNFRDSSEYSNFRNSDSPYVK